MAPIHHAARRGDVEELRRLLAAGYPPDAIQWMGGDFEPRRTPLHVLCRDCNDRSGRVACFKLLRDAGANLEATDAVDYTPLHHSASRSDVEIVSLLIQAGVNLNARAHDGSTPLHLVQHVRNARAFDCCELLLKAGAAVNLTTQYGWTPLDIAINRRHYRRWPLLLRAGAEFNKNHGPTGATVDQVCYFVRVRNAGGFKKYARNHLAAVTKLFKDNGRGLPPEVVRQIMKFWLHAGYY